MVVRIRHAIAAAVTAATALLSTAAHAQFGEPAAFESLHPDRDVLNGGQLTPEGRAALEQRNGGAGRPYGGSPYGATNVPNGQGVAPAAGTANRRRHSGQRRF